MKKSLGILLVLVLIATVFVACSQDAGQSVAEELVSVGFDGSKARSLTPSRDQFNADKYVWTYTAQKADTTGLTTGETTEQKRINDGKGLSGKVPGFSQGYWNFTLYAYEAEEYPEGSGKYRPVPDSDPLYSGTASHVKVAKGDENVITVSVSPATTGNGYIAFDKAHLFLNAIKTGEDINAQGDERSANFKYGIYNITDTSFENNLFNEVQGKTILPAGSYFVRVSYRVAGDGDDRFDIADEAIVAVVYGGQTTTITGSIGELSTDVSFGANEVEIPSAEGTPAVIPADLSNYADTDAGYAAYQAAPVTEEHKPIVDVKLDNATPTTAASVVATVPARAVYSLLQESIPDDPNTTSNMSLDLTVDINTQETTASQMAYDVNLIKTVETTTTTSTGSSTSTNASLVKNVAEYVAATIKVGAGLRDVKVYHSGNLMKKTADIAKAGTSAAPEDETEAADAARDYAGFFLYDDENGILYLKTKSFSPFVVTFTPDTIPETARVMNVTRGVGYVDLQDAVDAAVAGETLRLIDDIEDLNAQVDITKSLTLDLNGKTISNTVDIWNTTTGAWSLISVRGQGAVLTITGNGLLNAKENDCYALDVRDAEAGIIIENGTYVGNITAAYALIGSITVNGGSFDLKQLDSGSGEAPYRYMLNCLDANFKEGTAVITVTGGSFHMFNPAVTHGEPTDPTSYVADGYVSTYDASTAYYSVVPAVAKIGDTYFASLKDAADTAQSGDTIELLCDLTFYSEDFFVAGTHRGVGYDRKVIVSEIKNGVTFDGKDHKITFDGGVSNGYLFAKFDGNLCNLKMYYDGCTGSSIIASTLYDVVITNVCTYGTMNWTTGNGAAYVIYPAGAMSFVDCVNYATLQGNGDTSIYDAVFVGYALSSQKTYSFFRCGNEGSVVTGRAAMFIANASYGTSVTLDLTDCYNNGIVRTMADISVGGDSAADRVVNYYYAKPADRPHTLKVKVDGETYTSSTTTKWWEVNDKIGGTGSLLGCVVDDTLAISKNNDGSFTIVPATNESVSYYVVSVGLYVSTGSGSDRYYVTEQLNDSDTSIITGIKDLRFVDSQWVADHGSAVEGSLCNNKTYTYEGETYYLVDRSGRFLTNHDPKSSGMISVSAYGANDKLICAVQLIQP